MTIVHFCKEYRYTFITVSLALFSFYTLNAAFQKSPSLSERIKLFIDKNRALVITTFVSMPNKKPIDLRIKAHDTIESYCFSKALLEKQPLLALCVIPIDCQTQYDDYDIDIPYTYHTQIKEVLSIANAIATAYYHDRIELYQQFSNSLHQIEVIQVLAYQSILNTLHLRLNIDNSNQPDMIYSLLSENSYVQNVKNSSLDISLLRTIAQKDDALNAFITKLLDK